MAIRKASDSNLTGKKYNDASAGATKIPDLPDKPTLSSNTPGGTSESPSISFTGANTGGTVANFVVSDANRSFNATGVSSPISLTAANGIQVGTSYTFRVAGENTSGTGPFSTFTNAVTIGGYKLAQTYNTSTNYTVPSGVTKLGVMIINGGNGGGGAGNNAGGSGGSGGNGRGAYDLPVNSGTNYTITVGGAGGSSSFGNLVTTNAVNGTKTGEVSGGGGGGGNGGDGFKSPGNAGGAASPINLTLTIPTNGPYQHPLGGGGGGGGGPGGNNFGSPKQNPGGGGAGGQSHGGGGSGGAGMWTDSPPAGGGGGGGNGPGGGGGGGGASFNSPGPGGSGAGGRIFVYEYYA